MPPHTYVLTSWQLFGIVIASVFAGIFFLIFLDWVHRKPYERTKKDENLDKLNDKLGQLKSLFEEPPEDGPLKEPPDFPERKGGLHESTLKKGGVNDLSRWEGFGGTIPRPGDPPPMRPHPPRTEFFKEGDVRPPKSAGDLARESEAARDASRREKP
jgi:hypothetical protein